MANGPMKFGANESIAEGLESSHASCTGDKKKTTPVNGKSYEERMKEWY